MFLTRQQTKVGCCCIGLLRQTASRRQLQTLTPLLCAVAKASKKAAISNKTHYNVGTIGHVDHGKTTLTAAITKVLSEKKKGKYTSFDEIDRAPEEQRRGITINIANVGYETDKRHYAHTDCPGHRDFVKNMICGTSQMDAAILVLAATDGMMPQTREHLLLAKQIGVEHLIVFINKADAVEADMIELVEIEIKEEIAKFGFNPDNVPVVVGSALAALEGVRDDIGRGAVQNLLDTLDGLPEATRDVTAPFLMPITAAHSITGRGTVIVGTVEQGVLKKGEKIEVSGFGKSFSGTCSGMEAFKQSLPEAKAGDHVGVLVKGIRTVDVRRGQWMLSPGIVQQSNRFKASFYMLTPEEGGIPNGIRSGFTEKLFCTTWDQVARIMYDSKSRDLLMPGENCEIDVAMVKQMPLLPGIQFTLRTAKNTVGYGKLLNVEKSLPIFTMSDMRKADNMIEKGLVMV